MRLGVVPYLNGIPLIHGLTCEIYEAVPAQLPAGAQRDDIVLAPIVAPFLDPTWYLLDGVGIGSFGAVDSVKLFINKNNITIQNISKIYLDNESMTSGPLLKILLVYCFQRPLSSFQFLKAGSPLIEGHLYIGDKVWEQTDDARALDLGECWTNWTHLPFVYACWMTKNESLGRQWKLKLLEQAQSNLKQLETLVQIFEPARRPKILNYWKSLRYELGTPQKEAIALFQNYWSKMEGKSVLELKWI